MSEAKIYDKGQSEYVEDVNRAGDIDQANEQARLDDAELVAGEATEKVSGKKTRCTYALKRKMRRQARD
jgi:hypothetical protein